MRRYPALLLLTLVGVLAAGSAVHQARAEPLGIYISPGNEYRPDVSTPEGGGLNVPEGELRRRLEAELAKAAEQIPEWPCLKAVEAGRRSGPIPALQIEYDLRETTTLDLERGRVEAWEVSLRVLVSSRRFSGWITKDAYIFDSKYLDHESRHSAAVGEEFIQEVVQRAVGLLRQAVAESIGGEINPCEIATTLSGRSVLDLDSVKVTYTYQADSTLALTAGGSFDATAPMTIGIDFTVTSECQTKVTGQVVEPKLRAIGAYRADDGSLAFKELRITAAAITAQGTVTCPRGATASCSLDSRQSATLQCSNGTTSSFPFQMDGDMLDGQELRVELRNGAQKPLPRPASLPAGMTWDFSLKLGYGASAGPAVTAVVPADLPNRDQTGSRTATPLQD